MPSIHHIRKEVLQALDDAIIPALWQQSYSVGYVDMPLEFPAGMMTELVSKSIPWAEYENGEYPLQASWPRAQLHSSRYPVRRNSPRAHPGDTGSGRYFSFAQRHSRHSPYSFSSGCSALTLVQLRARLDVQIRNPIAANGSAPHSGF